MIIISRLILVILTLLCGSQVLWAATSVKNNPQNNGTITTKIKANFIDIKRQIGTAKLTGNVIVEREDLSMKADNMIIYYYEQKGEENDRGAIKKIEAKNNVKIFNGEFIATGKYGFYNPDQNTVILKENVIFNNGTSIANGEKFTYDLKTKKGDLIGNKNLPIKSQSDVSDGTKPDGRVIVIIDDNNAKQIKPNSNKQ